MYDRAEGRSSGVSITIKARRKSNGAVGSDRKNATGKKATICVPDQEPIVILGATYADVCSKIRKAIQVPAHIKIEKSGITKF